MEFTKEDGYIQLALTDATLYIVQELCDFLHLDTSVKDIVEARGHKYATFRNITREAMIFKGTERLILAPQRPKLIRVEINEMGQHFTGSGHNKTIAIYTPDTFETDTNHHFYVQPRREYFDLNTQRESLSSISVKLFDEDNLPITIVDGFPTLIQFKIKQMAGNYFPLQLTSSDSNSLFANNTNSNFKILLPFPLMKQNKSYQVALSSIFFPSRMDMQKILDEDFYIEFTSPSRVKWWRINFLEMPDYSLTTIAQRINDEIPKLLKVVPISAKVTEEEEMRITCELEGVYVHPSPLFSLLFSKSPISQERQGHKGEVFNMGKLTSLDRCCPEFFQLHCSIIDPSIVGDTNLKILKMIPFTHKITEENHYVKYEPQNLDFYNISGGEREKQLLHFQLTNYQGKEIPFIDQKNFVMINLIFREIN
jgi:hypothetical protein